jgi:hypothetical protein
MWWICFARAVELIVNAEVPARVAVDGKPAAELYLPGILRVEVAVGPHVVQLVASELARADGTGVETFKVDAVEGEPIVMFVGRAGISYAPLSARAAGAPAVADAQDLVQAQPPDLGPWPVRFRAAPGERLLVVVDDRRVFVAPGEDVQIELGSGDHRCTVRSTDGTMLYARGYLRVRGGDAMIVLVGEGMLPTASGDGVAFLPDAR